MWDLWAHVGSYLGCVISQVATLVIWVLSWVGNISSGGSCITHLGVPMLQVAWHHPFSISSFYLFIFFLLFLFAPTIIPSSSSYIFYFRSIFCYLHLCLCYFLRFLHHPHHILVFFFLSLWSAHSHLLNHSCSLKIFLEFSP